MPLRFYARLAVLEFSVPLWRRFICELQFLLQLHNDLNEISQALNPFYLNDSNGL